MSQVPILEALIDANTGARNWEELNRNYHLLLWVHQRNMQANDPALLPVILAVGRWELEAYSKSLLKQNPESVLQDVMKTFSTTVEMIEHQYGENDPRLIAPLKILSLAGYQLASETASSSLGDFEGFGSSVVYQRSCIPIIVGGRVQMYCELIPVGNPDYYVTKQQNKDLQVVDQMSRIKSLLNRIVNISTASTEVKPAEKAAALINLGDWYFINKKTGTALENYKQAYAILEASDADRGLLGRLFDRPVQIPVMTTGLPMASDPGADKLTPPYVRLAFDVTADGRSKNIEVIEESEPGSFRTRSNATQIVKASVFRPRLHDGKLVATKATDYLVSGPVLQNTPARDRDHDNFTSALKLHR